MRGLLLRTIVVIAVLAVSATAWGATSKLDPLARRAVRELRAGRTVTQMIESQVSVNSEGDLDVFITGNVSRGQLEAAGATVRTELPGLFTAFVPVDALDAVEAIAGVTRIQGAAPVELQLDASVPTTGVTVLRTLGPAFTGLNGAGVILADVDTGVDYKHGDFKDAGGNTRLVNIWDQTDNLGPNPFGYAYGSEWNATDINTLVARQKDTNGHGTHCMGIMGGDGSQTGGAIPAFTYVGMAPMADLLEVKTDLTTTHIIDGVNYTMGRATALGKNAVCNLSLGSQYGPHDGSSPFETALTAMTGPGRVIVVSAGNDGGTKKHGQVFATPGGAIGTMTISGSAVNRYAAIDGWYDATENMTYTVKTPNGTILGPYARGTDNGGGGTATANGTVYIENGTATSSNGAYEVYFEVDVLSGNNMNGTWTFTFTRVGAPGPKNSRYDGWMFAAASGVAANWATGNDQGEMLTSEPSNAVGVLCTAAWATKQNWIDCGGRLVGFTGAPAPGNLATFSSPGPSRDGRPKPDIAAPGTPIGSARSSDIAQVCGTTASLLLPDGINHTINQGTSMAAPHLAGMAALLMQQYGAVTPQWVRHFVLVHAKVDLFTGGVWNNAWGYGKLYYGTASDPSVAVVVPNGGEIASIGGNTTLSWTAVDPDGTPTVDLRLSRDNGTSWEVIALGVPNTGSFVWTTTGPTTNNALLGVAVHDGLNNVNGDISDATWQIIDQPVATLLSMFVAESVNDGIQLRWGFADAAHFTRVSLERAAQSAGPFTGVTADVVQGGDMTTALDRSVTAGQTYYYRLVAQTADGQSMTFGPLAGTFGQSLREFAISRVTPNPTHGPARVDFVIPTQSDVRISVIDVQGREVATLANGLFRPGAYQATWNGRTDKGQAPAGLYFVRLRTAGHNLTSRVVLAR